MLNASGAATFEAAPPAGSRPWDPGAALVPIHGRALPLETGLNRVLSFGIGLFLGVLTIRTEYVGTPTDFFSRVAPVDILCILFFFVLFFRHSMKLPPRPALLYGSVIVVSMVPGLLFATGEEKDVFIGASALLMAFAYYIVGQHIGDSKRLLTDLIAGLCIAVAGQAIIVFHDVVSPNQWFPDPMEKRVRGTFKANGQLGAYGYCAAGLLITFGTAVGSAAMRRISVILAATSASFAFLASRRTGMVSVIAWGVLFIVLGRKFSRTRAYKVFFGVYLAALITVAALWPQIEASFVGQRFMSAMSTVGESEGFIQNQFKDVVNSADRWFPFGFGVGMGSEINKADGHEVHNCFLAVLVELGVLGLIGWLAMTLLPLLKLGWRARSKEHELFAVMLSTFLLISLVFMIHNTLDRDRTFLLYLGLATAVVAREKDFSRPSELFPDAPTTRGVPGAAV